jgi:hypothetical protein
MIVNIFFIIIVLYIVQDGDFVNWKIGEMGEWGDGEGVVGGWEVVKNGRWWL